nr:PREDICTED: TNFAIP3-interacting protein 3 isoform X2 [Latimeria chalumnae]|eukprot:XP_014345912.1 PREDICTED: TNFAIP3-interacting protein 3 isoform X2 [Latimeria chalumnae]
MKDYHLGIEGRSGEMERCESVELNSEIKVHIEKQNTLRLKEKLKPPNLTCPGVLQACCTSGQHRGRTSEEKEMMEDHTESLLSLEKGSIGKMQSQKEAFPGLLEQQIKTLEEQRREISDVRGKLASSQKYIGELKKEWALKQRDFDKKLLLAKEKLEQEAGEKKRLNVQLQELQQQKGCLREQSASVNTKKDQYEHEISRLNKALLEALKKQSSSLFGPLSLDESTWSSVHQELMTQNDVLKQQVQIYEDDFKKERCDRERLNEKKEELTKINEELQLQLKTLSSQIKNFKKEKEMLERKLNQKPKSLAQPVPSQYLLPPPYLPACTPCVNYGHAYGLQLLCLAPKIQNEQQDSQDHQQHPPDYQWYVPNQLPPDVKQNNPNYKANGKSSQKDSCQK